MASLTNLVQSAGGLLSGPAAAGLQDLGEVLASSQEVGHRGSALAAQGRSQRLVDAGQTFSTCLERKVNAVELLSGSSKDPARFLLRNELRWNSSGWLPAHTWSTS